MPYRSPVEHSWMRRPDLSTSDHNPDDKYRADQVGYAPDGLVPVSFFVPLAFLDRLVDKTELLRDGSNPCRALACSLLQMRHRRSALLATNVPDPVLNMMFELYVARFEDRAVDVTSLYRASGVAETTAQGHVSAWLKSGDFVKVGAPDDGRRSYMSLSPEPLDKLERYLSRCIDILAVHGFTFKGSA